MEQTFSILVLRDGYYQLTLAPESRYIATFATHAGLRTYRKLNFGTCSASKIFQNVFQEQIQGIPNVINISDHVIVYGTTQTEQDNKLRSVFQRLCRGKSDMRGSDYKICHTIFEPMAAKV